MLHKAAENDIVLLYLPSHTTHYLQPLDREFFGPFKRYLKNACDEWGISNANRKLERCRFGELLSQAWSRSATAVIAISWFRATGIFPLQWSAISEHAFLQPGSGEQEEEQRADSSSGSEEESCKVSTVAGPEVTPTKILGKVSPIPNPRPGKVVRKQSAAILTDPKYIAVKQEKKEAAEGKKKAARNSEEEGRKEEIGSWKARYKEIF